MWFAFSMMIPWISIGIGTTWGQSCLESQQKNCQPPLEKQPMHLVTEGMLWWPLNRFITSRLDSGLSVEKNDLNRVLLFCCFFVLENRGF